MNCACGKPLHYPNPDSERKVLDITKRVGEYIPVTYEGNGKTYMVQRHYIALHGIKGANLPELAKQLGFKEVKNEGH